MYNLVQNGEKRLELSGHPKNGALRPHYLRTDWTKIPQFDWWVVIDEDYIICKEVLFISKIWSTYKLLKNGSN